MTRVLAAWLIASVLVGLFLALFIHAGEGPTVDASAVTTTTAWPTETIATLPIGFDPAKLAPPATTIPPSPAVRHVARSAPTRTATATGAIPDLIRTRFAQRFGGLAGAQAVRVSSCETGGTFNPAIVNASGHTGLFQLSPRYHTERARRLGFTWAQMREAEPNIAVAMDLYAEQGWQPWTCRYAA